MNTRHKSKRIVVFNHKGGVGKTTLTVNIAYALAELGKRVLLVDSDPQCNLTSYLVDDAVVDDLLDNSDSENGATLWTALKPIAEAEGDIKVINPIQLSNDNLFLLPGDIRLSEFEIELTEFWGQCTLRKAKGFRGTTAFSRLVNSVATSINADFVLYDTGPNIGPLNRVILLDCDYFIVPVACDLFSLRALKTLGKTLYTWITQWSQVADLAPEDICILPGTPSFLGYIPERFRIYRGEVASTQSGFLIKIQKEIHSQIVSLMRGINPDFAVGKMNDFKLGQVKDFSSLVPASQLEGIAMSQTQNAIQSQKDQAKETFSTISTNIINRVEELDSNG
ncbi:MAG: AAA family ATPase [Gammaproteobacteria bacterium]|nr:AAA family ATPase [Gammaproteobacteria bacterium]MCW8923132.1 AAA family ATPase [Gammaproteobacteria bacterium]